MSRSTESPAINLRPWADYYADRWQIDAATLTNVTYGPDAFPMSSELRQRVSLLHEIAAFLDQLFPLERQGVYWHLPWRRGEAPPASLLETGRASLEGVRDDLRDLIDLLAVEAGSYEPGVRALDSLLSALRPAAASPGDSGIPSVDGAQAAASVANIWANWPDSAAVGIVLGGQVRHPKRVASRMRSTQKLLAVSVPGEQGFRYPPCQFDDARVLPVMKDLLSTLPEGSGSGWFRAFWLYSANPSLANLLPANLLATRPEAVLHAARGALQPQSYLGW
jgi:hypothetical protein